MKILIRSSGIDKHPYIHDIYEIKEGNIYFKFGGVFDLKDFEWLKPVKDVYVLTEEELNEIKERAFEKGYAKGCVETEYM